MYIFAPVILINQLKKRTIMIKTLRYSLMAAVMFLCGSMSAQEVTLDFTSNDGWNIPTAKTTAEQTFTNGGYSVTLASTGNSVGYYFNANKGDGYLMLGKKGATLTLQKFDFAVSKIEVVGHKGASASVVQNFYVGDNEVSTATTGAAQKVEGSTQTGDAVTNSYDIAADYQAAGNQYTLKVTSNHNTQITKILIYKAGGVSKKSAGLAFSAETVNYEVGTTFTAPTFSKETTAAVKFSSDNEYVATVNSDGTITLGDEEGTAVITAESEANAEYNEGKATCTIYVYHYNVFTKASTVEAGKKYLIVAQRDGKTYYAMPGKQTYTYGYLNASTIDETVNKILVKSTYNDEFTFAAVDGGYSIADCYGRYLYMDDSHYSFQFGSEASAWTVEPADNGTFTISNNGKYIQFGQGTYTTFGAWAEAQENAVKPMLFVYDEGATTGVNDIKANVKAENNARFNIAGQRVGKNYKGLVIVNGKKQLVK